MRRTFSDLLYRAMEKDDRIFLLVGDLGFGMFDKIKGDFKDRFLNVGAAENLLIGAAVGLAIEGKIPICYSITSFLLKRPFEFIDLYLSHENIPVKLVGGGLYQDYGNLGYSHHSDDVHRVLNLWPNIRTYFPSNKLDLTHDMVEGFLYNGQPSFMGLRR